MSLTSRRLDFDDAHAVIEAFSVYTRRGEVWWRQWSRQIPNISGHKRYEKHWAEARSYD